MPWITVATPAFESIDKVDEVIAQVGTQAGGLQARYAGRADDGKLRVISVWETKTDAERFFAEKLGPTLAKLMGPEPGGAPEVFGVNVERSYVAEPAG